MPTHQKTRTILTEEMGHQLFEERFSRDAITKKLTQMCERLDEKHKNEGEYEPYPNAKPQSYRLCVEMLYVFGSYARGALTCGDLDTLVQCDAYVNFEDRDNASQTVKRQGERLMIRPLLGTLPGVRLYMGTPEKNESGLPIEAAIAIWTGQGCDWKKAIAAIKPDPLAGRFKRPLDEIPFRIEQLNPEMKYESVVSMKEEGILAFKFMPITKQDLDPLMGQELLEGCAPEIFRRTRDDGMKTRDLIPALVRCMRTERKHWAENAVSNGHKEPLNLAGALFKFGARGLDCHDLYEMPFGADSIAVVPHFSKRGPNGFWMIGRGPNHPQVVAMKKKTFWIPMNNGSPQFELQKRVNPPFPSLIKSTLRVSTKEKHPASWPKNLKLEKVSGESLFDMVGGADDIMINNAVISMRERYRCFNPDYPTSTERIFKALGVTVASFPEMQGRLNQSDEDEGMAKRVKSVIARVTA